MSKHKNQKNKTATPKEPVTRHDLCGRICDLQQKIYTLRQINTSLTNSVDFLRKTSQKAIKFAEDSMDKLERMTKCVRHYRTMNKFLIVALILSGLSHLINLFI